MLSNARIYIFKISYQNSTWLTFRQSDLLSGLISQMLLTGIKELKFKNIEIINVYEEKIHNVEIHINKISYDNDRILSKEQISFLRNRLRGQFKKIVQFKFEDILVVNDEFRFKSSELVGG